MAPNYYPGYAPYAGTPYGGYMYQQTGTPPPQPVQAPQPTQQPPQQPVIQSGGLIPVKSEEEAFNWPMAPGMSITFFDETARKIYVKTKSFNQFEPPVFERFRVEKEEPAQNAATEQPQTPVPVIEYASSADVAQLWAAVNDIREAIKPKRAAKAPAKDELKEGAE